MAASGLFSTLKGLAQKIKAKPAPLPQKESRVYQRFDLTHSNLFRAQLPDGSSAPILDISFGGLRLGGDQSGDNFPIVISVLGRSVPSVIGVTHRGSSFCGSRFDKTEPALLKFLQPLLAALEQGLSLRQIDSAALKDTTKESFEFVLRGEGPTDLLIGSLVDPTAHVVLTFRVDKEYLVLTLKNLSLVTGRTIDDHGRSARMSLDSSVDAKTLEHALLILTGAMAQAELQDALGPIIAALQKHLES